MKRKIENLIRIWQKRNISGFYCKNKDDAVKKILEIIPLSSSIGLSGSLTLEQLDIIRQLEIRGDLVFDPYKATLSRQESSKIRRQGATEADYYLASANAVSEKGELVFFSAYGNRVAGISYAPNVIIACGINKLTLSLDEALKRAREYVAPLNCKRLKWNTPCFKDAICGQEICDSLDYRRMCCQTLIIEAEVTPDRLRVILVGENLGF